MTKSEGTVVQLARCVLCTHRGFPSGQFVTETCPTCGCKCKFSVVVQEVDRCVDCGQDKESGEVQTKASSCSQIVIPQDNELNAAQEKRLIGCINTAANNVWHYADQYRGVYDADWLHKMVVNAFKSMTKAFDHVTAEQPSTSDVFNTPERGQHSPASPSESGLFSADADVYAPTKDFWGSSPSESKSVVTVDEAARKLAMRLCTIKAEEFSIEWRNQAAAIITTELSADANEATELKQAVRDYFNIDPAENAAEWCAASNNLLRLAGLPVDHAPAPRAPDVGAEAVAQAVIDEFAGCMLVPDGYTHESFYLRRMTDVIAKALAASPVPSKDDQEGDLK